MNVLQVYICALLVIIPASALRRVGVDEKNHVTESVNVSVGQSLHKGRAELTSGGTSAQMSSSKKRPPSSNQEAYLTYGFIILTAVATASLAFAMNMTQTPASEIDKQGSDANERFIHLDMMRTACVLVWVVRHGNNWANVNNIIFYQNWAAPLLWLISGICWGRSRTPLWTYLLRLAALFCVGTALNAVAWKFQKPHEYVDPWNVVFHMWFVVGLMVVTCITAPYKTLADQGVKNRSKGAVLWSTAPWMTLACAAIFLSFEAVSATVTPTWPGLQYWIHGNSGTLSLPLTEAAVFHFMVMCAFLSTRGRDIFPWLFLVYFLGILVIYQHSRVGMEITAMNLFVVGVAVERLGLRGQVFLGDLFTGKYILLGLLLCVFLGTHFRGATDYQPSDQMSVRAEWSAITFIMITAFLCAADRVQDPLELFTRFPGLKYWAPFLYIVHIAVLKVMSSPFNWLFLAGSVVPFMFMPDLYKTKQLLQKQTPS